MGMLFLVMMIVLAQLNGSRSFMEKERKGLLELKAFLNSDDVFPDFEILRDWTNDTESDCCRWERIKCDLTTGRVIGLSLNRSVYSAYPYPLLNLSSLHPFEELRSLDLSSNDFGGWFDRMEGYKSLQRLRKLEILDLSSNGYNASILPFPSVAASLKTLILRENQMNGPFSIKELKNLVNLEVLDLSENNLNDSLPAQELVNLNKLEVLGLSGNGLSGSLEVRGICELKNLIELDLSRNKFLGQLPRCFGSLTKLRALDLSSNQLSGKLLSTISGLESLEYLSLSGNGFDGLFSFSPLANLSNLTVFKLSSGTNLLQVQMEDHWLPKFELSVLALPYCNLEEIPSFLLYQKEPRLIDLSNNRLSGNFPTRFLENNPELDVLLLQNNSFTSFKLPVVMHNLRFLDVSDNNFDDLLPEKIGQILTNLRHMNLSKNGFQGNLPSSLGEMINISFLDLSHNNFSGKLPRSFVMGCHSLDTLKLSHNRFTGQIFPKSTSFISLTVLMMDNNHVTGKIGDGLLNSSGLITLAMSNNFLTGTITRWMGNWTFLSMLLVSNNSLEGTIPVSLFENSTLDLLDLSENKSFGTLPSRFKKSGREGMLYLHSNDFTGSIPHTLLENVSIIDLRNSKLSGNIPQFVNTQIIIILLLRGNNFTGLIPRQLCELSNIKLLDLAYNRLNGSIPSCLANISFGLGGDVEPPNYGLRLSYLSYSGKYYESMLLVDKFSLDNGINLNAEIEFASKQRYDSYTRGNLGSMFGLDLSSNQLSSEIPAELGGLQKLRAMNLSHNNLPGFIPESFSNLKDMESLDLSFNTLYGRIPPQLTSLYSLAVFNVSYNNLSGTIPEGGQFNTFDQSSYIGNPLLRAPAINRSRNANSSGTAYYRRKDDEAAIDMVLFYWSFASTFVTVIMGFLLFLCFDSPRRQAWFHLIDAFIRSVKSIWP